MTNESLSRFCEFCEKATREGIDNLQNLILIAENSQQSVYQCKTCGKAWKLKIKDRQGIPYA